MNTSAVSNSSWLGLLQQFEEKIHSFLPHQSYDLYRLLNVTYAQIAPTDSFYVCIFEPNYPEPLWYPYNMDNKKFPSH